MLWRTTTGMPMNVTMVTMIIQVTTTNIITTEITTIPMTMSTKPSSSRSVLRRGAIKPRPVPEDLLRSMRAERGEAL
jgi:hypothetical protein